MAEESTFAVLTDDKATADELVAQGIIAGYAYLGNWSVTETEYIIVVLEDEPGDCVDTFIAQNQTNGCIKLRKTRWR